MLGIHHVPKGDGMSHIEAMKEKGMERGNRLETSPFPLQDTWLSFYMQLSKSMSYGLGLVIISPKKLDELMQLVYYRIIPLLNVNKGASLANVTH